MKLTFRLKGGPGSGNHGHAGRPGKVGGSADDENAASPTQQDRLESFKNPKFAEGQHVIYPGSYYGVYKPNRIMTIVGIHTPARIFGGLAFPTIYNVQYGDDVPIQIFESSLEETDKKPRKPKVKAPPVSKVSEASKKAMVKYTNTDWCYDINGRLRSGDEFVETDPDVIAMDDYLKNGKKTTASVLYRGFGWAEGEDLQKTITSLSPGDEISDKGYSSTSLSEDSAFLFTENYDGAAMFRIKGVRGKGTEIAPEDAYNQNERLDKNYEQEVILPRGTVLKVVSVKPYKYGDNILLVDLIVK